MVALSLTDTNNYQYILNHKKDYNTEHGKNKEDRLRNERAYPGYEEAQIRHKHIQHQKWLTPAEIEQVIAGYLNGITVEELSKQYGCHRQTISKNLRRSGIIPTNEKAVNVQEIIVLYASGMKVEDIANQFSVSCTVIRKRLAANGVKMRNRWDYEKDLL